jgi:ferredoxin-like protein FixX
MCPANYYTVDAEDPLRLSSQHDLERCVWS